MSMWGSYGGTASGGYYWTTSSASTVRWIQPNDGLNYIYSVTSPSLARSDAQQIIEGWDADQNPS